MAKIIKIKITFSQYADGMSSPADTVVETEAKYYKKDDVCYLFYEEKDKESGLSVKTRMDIGADATLISRTGGLNYRMELKKGRKTSMKYPTPYGLLNLETLVTGYKPKIKEKEIALYLSYDILEGGKLLSHNKVEIDTL